MLARMSRFWRAYFRAVYSILALLDPLIRAWWEAFGLGNVLEVRVPRRAGRGTRSRLLGLLRVDDRRYLGHPSGHVGWTRDLAACRRATLVWPAGRGQEEVRAELLPPGAERDAAVSATSQHPFPGNAIYWLGRAHVRRVGVFFRLTALDEQRN